MLNVAHRLKASVDVVKKLKGCREKTESGQYVARRVHLNGVGRHTDHQHLGLSRLFRSGPEANCSVKTAAVDDFQAIQMLTPVLSNRLN